MKPTCFQVNITEGKCSDENSGPTFLVQNINHKNFTSLKNKIIRLNFVTLYILFIFAAKSFYAQNISDDNNRYPKPVTFTAEQDHQNMMNQLGIKSVRPGPSGNENAPNHANYDESIANPCPQLPDILTMNNGTKVTNAEMWWKQRRPEIIDGLESEV